MTYQFIGDSYTGPWDMSLEHDNYNYYWYAIDTIDGNVACVWHLLLRKPLHHLGYYDNTCLLSRQIMTCELIDIVYFTFGTADYEFKCYEKS